MINSLFTTAATFSSALEEFCDIFEHIYFDSWTKLQWIREKKIENVGNHKRWGNEYSIRAGQHVEHRLIIILISRSTASENFDCGYLCYWKSRLSGFRMNERSKCLQIGLWIISLFWFCSIWTAQCYRYFSNILFSSEMQVFLSSVPSVPPSAHSAAHWKARRAHSCRRPRVKRHWTPPAFVPIKWTPWSSAMS